MARCTDWLDFAMMHFVIPRQGWLMAFKSTLHISSANGPRPRLAACPSSSPGKGKPSIYEFWEAEVLKRFANGCILYDQLSMFSVQPKPFTAFPPVVKFHGIGLHPVTPPMQVPFPLQNISAPESGCVLLSDRWTVHKTRPSTFCPSYFHLSDVIWLKSDTVTQSPINTYLFLFQGRGRVNGCLGGCK